MLDIWNAIFIEPIINLLAAFYQGLIYVHVPYALGFAIILLTIFIRLLIYPFMHQSMKHQKKMQELQPEMNKIKAKHKGDMKQQQTAMMAMYKEQGINPAGGCLPVLIQIPLLIALYQVLFAVVNAKTVNDINKLLYFPQLKLTELWNTTFFGIPIEKTPGQLLSEFGVIVIIIVIVTSLLQLLQSKMMMTSPGKAPVHAANKEKSPEDFAVSFQKQLLFIMPLMIGFASFTLPMGLSLYWNTLTIFGIIQQYQITKWGGLTEWFTFLNRK